MKLQVRKFLGQWEWVIRASNGRIVASSNDSYTRKHDAKQALVRHVLACGRTAGKLRFVKDGKTWRHADLIDTIEEI